jgi:hypothetical protein
MKTVTFTIEPFTEGLKRFKEPFEAVRAGRPVARDIVGFTSLEAARNFLTRERLGLLRTIIHHRFFAALGRAGGSSRER